MTAAIHRRPTRVARRLRALGIAAGGILALLIVLPVSLAGVLLSARPADALRWAPYNALASAHAAGNVASLGLDRASAAQVDRLARASLARDPTAVKALFALGASADATGNRARAERLMRRASILSLRERGVQMWFLRYHFDKADIPAAMREFDLALRSSNRNWGQIFSLLISLSPHPVVARELSERLAREPEWGPQFLAQLAESSPDLPSAAAIAEGHLDPRDPYEQVVIATLIRRLATEGEPALAWQMYREISDSTPATVRGGGFERAGPYPPIDWLLTDQPDFSASLQPVTTSSGGNALFLAAYNDNSGELARQLLHLAPGRYAFTATAGNFPSDPLDRPTIHLTCHLGPAAGRHVLELRPLGRMESVVQLRETFAVPAGCQWQWLTISLSGQGPSGDASIWIDDLAIKALDRASAS